MQVLITVGNEYLLFPNNLYEHALVAHTVKFPVEYLLPCSEIKFAASDGDNNLAPHDRALQMSIGVVLIAIMDLRRSFEIRNNGHICNVIMGFALESGGSAIA